MSLDSKLKKTFVGSYHIIKLNGSIVSLILALTLIGIQYLILFKNAALF